MSDYEVTGHDVTRYNVSHDDIPGYEALDSARVGPPGDATAQHPVASAREGQTQAILRSVAIGAVAGMRSMTPLALLSIAAQEPGTPVSHAVAHMPLLRHLRSRSALVTFGLAALGELVGDKLPFIPARVTFGPLLGRVIIGAAAGAVVSAGWSGSAERGARRGAAAAFLAAWFGYTARTQLSRHTPIPDPVVAIAEDALAIGIGILALWPSLEPSVRYLLSQFPTSDRSNGTCQAGAEQAPGWAYASGRTHWRDR